MNKALFAILFCAAIGLCAGQAGVTTGKCPKHEDKVLPAFNFTRYLGVWYEQERIENLFQEDGDCTLALYQDNLDGRMMVRNSQVNSDGSIYTENGRATQTKPPAGVFQVSFPLQPALGDNYNIIDTDYDTYTIIWNCYQVSPIFKLDGIWFLAREENLGYRPPAVAAFLDAHYAKTELRPTRQSSDCVNRGQLIP